MTTVNEVECRECGVQKCPFCHRDSAYIIIVNGEKRLICYAAGCHYEQLCEGCSDGKEEKKGDKEMS